jgi:hypothetical protein
VSSVSTVDFSIGPRVGFTREIAQGIRLHLPLHFVAGITWMGGLLLAWQFSLPADFSHIVAALRVLMMILVLFMLVAALATTVKCAVKTRPESLLREVSEMLRRRFLSTHVIVNLANAIIAMSLFHHGYLQIKRAIPFLNPFAWDKAFAELDRIIHFGYQPFELLAWVLPTSFATFIIANVYISWFIVMLICWVGFGALLRDDALRVRFLLAFMLTWLMGSGVLGTVFSSVGPCFYDRLLGDPGPYLSLMSSLSTANSHWHISAVGIQEVLWQSYVIGGGEVGGISAMPSMHVASAVLFALAGMRVDRRLGWLLWAYALVIFLGSVHLAWHYAIDGYAGAGLALLFWLVAGHVVMWSRARDREVTA